MKALLTGGTGFIGSHTAVALLEAGNEVMLYDNLYNSSERVVGAIEEITGKKPGFMKGDIRDEARMKECFTTFKPDLVIHFAGLKTVGESVAKPLEYYDNNVGGTLAMLRAMRETGCRRLIFSSSATVYDLHNPSPYIEGMPVTHATSPYGETKIQIETILRDLAKAESDWSFVNLRYFNPIGAHPSGLIGEDPNGIPNNLVPYVARVAHGRLPFVRVFGGDYPTRDGTGVRDYIHVMDLAEGHAAAANYCLTHKGEIPINLGTGRGSSVLDIIHAYEKACGHEIPYKIMDRRAGDLPSFFASADRAKSLLGWTAKRGLEEMCRDSWNFEQHLAGKSA